MSFFITLILAILKGCEKKTLIFAMVTLLIERIGRPKEKLIRLILPEWIEQIRRHIVLMLPFGNFFTLNQKQPVNSVVVHL
jgi:hypothetical protein